MKPGDLRRFKNGPYGLDNDGFEGSTFMVLRVGAIDADLRVVDILLDGGLETDLGYLWVMNHSEVISEAG
jgi:hypothetical protein